MRPGRQIAREPCKKAAVARQPAERGDGRVRALARDPAGRLEPVHRYARHLSRPGVLARGLAKRRRVGGGVEDVIHDLEGEAELAAALAQGGEGGLRGACAKGAHRAFDEATALLAGDALLTRAFAILAKSYRDRPALAASLVAELADAAGSRRLIGGQMEDLLAERKAGATDAALQYIHLNKTAAMIEASLAAGALCAGAPQGALATLREGGRELGLAFQIVDDILDATSDSATLGKTVGKDARAGKATYVSVHGLEAARRIARERSEAAVAAFRRLPGDTSFLAGLALDLAARSH